MSRDPAFLFYPGDYLRDTTGMPAKVQVIYDKILCSHISTYDKHMLNICSDIAIRHGQDIFVQKGIVNSMICDLSKDETEILFSVIVETDTGYYIPWVRESILKRKSYVNSRRENRAGKSKKNKPSSQKHMSNICETYVEHMEIEIENNSSLDKLLNKPSNQLSISNQYSFKGEVLDNNNKLESRIFQDDRQEKIEKLFFEVYNEFKRMRIVMGKPLTPYAEQLLVEKLEAVTTDTKGKIEILKQSIVNGWSSLVPIKETFSNRKNLSVSPEEIIQSLDEKQTSNIPPQELTRRVKSIIAMVNGFIEAFPDHDLSCNIIWLKTTFVPKYIHLKPERLSKIFKYLKDNYRPFGDRFPIIADFESALEKTYKPSPYKPDVKEDFVPYQDHQVQALFSNIRKKLKPGFESNSDQDPNFVPGSQGGPNLAP